MKIKLKENNSPKKEGYYIVKKPGAPRPEVAAIRLEGYSNTLIMLSGIGIYPVADCGPALWSDAITFDPEK